MPTDEPLDPAQPYDYALFWLVIFVVSAVLVLRDTGTIQHKALWLFVLAVLPCVGLLLYYWLGSRTLNLGHAPKPRKPAAEKKTDG